MLATYKGEQGALIIVVEKVSEGFGCTPGSVLTGHPLFLPLERGE